MEIQENLAKITEQIGNNNVKIIAVTKYASKEQILEVHKLGIHDFGESYVQKALTKISEQEELKDKINWHFIGRLQKNKVKFVIGKFNLIHSVDSVELTELINNISNRKEVIQDILLQANVSQDLSKAGFNPTDLLSNFDKLSKLPNIKIKGLMTIAPNTNDVKIIRKCFLNLKELKEEINKEHNLNLRELSMGMSNDYKIAIECGATIIRLGRAIFTDFKLIN